MRELKVSEAMKQSLETIEAALYEKHTDEAIYKALSDLLVSAFTNVCFMEDKSPDKLQENLEKSIQTKTIIAAARAALNTLAQNPSTPPLTLRVKVIEELQERRAAYDLLLKLTGMRP